MAKPSRFTFSLLRLMLSMAAMAVILAIGHWIDSPLAPIAIATATAGLLMFVIHWRQVPVLLFEASCALLGTGVACLPRLLPTVGRHAEDSVLVPAIVGALFGWFVGCCCV